MEFSYAEIKATNENLSVEKTYEAYEYEYALQFDEWRRMQKQEVAYLTNECLFLLICEHIFLFWIDGSDNICIQ